MAKQNDNTLMIAGLALAGFFLYSAMKENEPARAPLQSDDDITPILNPVVQPGLPANYSNGYPVILGKYHPDVKALQALLGIKQDGVFGSNTLTALQKILPQFTQRFKFENATQLMEIVNLVRVSRYQLIDVSKPSPDQKYYPIIMSKYNPDAKLIQAALGVKQDGVIGPATLAAWKKVVPQMTERFKINNIIQLKDFIASIKVAQNFF